MKKWTDMTERERDVLVAKAAGWQRVYHYVDRDGEYAHGIATDGSGAQWDNIPHYSTDHASAMTLLDGGWLKMWRADRTEQPHFSMTIKTKDDEVFISGMRDTFPEAICVAFLRAKGVEIE